MTRKSEYRLQYGDQPYRYEIKHYRYNIFLSVCLCRHTNGKLVHPPNGLFGFGGSPSVLLNRRTVSFAARSPLANSILAWTYRRPFGFMNFFATINYNPRLKLPGTYEGKNLLSYSL